MKMTRKKKVSLLGICEITKLKIIRILCTYVITLQKYKRKVYHQNTNLCIAWICVRL